MKNAKGILSGLPKRCYRNTSKCPNCGEMLCARYKPKFCPKCNAETGGTHEPKAKKQRISKCAEIYTIENYRLFSVRTSTKDDRCFTVMSTGMETICHAAQCKNLRSIYVASGKTEQFTCQHLDIIRATPEDLRSSIYSVQCFSHEEIDDFTPDEKIRCEMKKIQNDCFPAVVKVSQKMYAVKGSATASNPTGYCHVKAESAQSQTLGKYQVPFRLNCCSEDCSGKKYGRTKQVKSRSLCIHIHCTILAMKIKEELSTVDRPTDQPDFDYSDSVASTSLTVRPSGTPHDSGVQTEVRHDVYSAQSTQDQDDMSLWLLSSGLSISKVSTLQLQLKRKLPYKIPVNILQKLTFMDSKHIPNLGGGPLLSYSSDREDNIKVDKSCCTFHPKSSICVLCSPSYAGIDYDGETHSFFEGWPDCFQPSESECLVCSASLSDSMTPQGSVTSYNGFMFTNQNPFKKVTIKVKKCLNTNCRAVHKAFLYDIGKFLICINVMELARVSGLFFKVRHLLPIHVLKSFLQYGVAFRKLITILLICNIYLCFKRE